jgi:hypothetical protein
MLALRYAALLALAVWVGGLVVLGAAAAPSIFDVLGAAGGEGRVRAAAVFGEVLRRFHVIAYVCGGTVIASLLLRGVLGPRPRRFAVRLSLAGMMLASTAWIGFIVAPELARVQQEIGGLPSSLPPDDERRVAFARGHRLSTMLELVPLVGGVALLFWELKD